MIFYKNQIINPDNFRDPSFYISPFRTSDLEKNNHIFHHSRFNESTNEIYNKLFGNHTCFLTGKLAINKALNFYNLKKEDEVLILTTTSNLYVSSCVTSEIEKFCSWRREKTTKTKIIFIIHEFGKIYEDWDLAKSYNLPIIEDCAMSLFSNDNQKSVGTKGDFTIYSLPKFFPIQFGGILRSNLSDFQFEDKVDSYTCYLQSVIKHYLSDYKNIIQKRTENNIYLLSKLSELGFLPYFDYTENETPSVCMFRNNGIDLSSLKVFLQKNGVECSIFYGEDAFFLPVHQSLTNFEMDFLINLVEYFCHENK